MRQLYLGLKDRANTQVIERAGVPRFKYIGMWNNQLELLKAGKILGFRLPALLFEFESPSPVDSVGNGVQVFDPFKIKCHILHEFYDAKNGDTAINLDVFDIEKYLYLAFQLHEIKGADYGCSPLNRTGIDFDYDHDNIYHCIPEYTTTWTDSSMSQPVGGYDIDPPLDADITSQYITGL